MEQTDAQQILEMRISGLELEKHAAGRRGLRNLGVAALEIVAGTAAMFAGRTIEPSIFSYILIPAGGTASIAGMLSAVDCLRTCYLVDSLADKIAVLKQVLGYIPQKMGRQ